ncbi:MAG: apolipoprotein N-acyltransferase [Spirochaetaceae bacterium]|jgi:apolipoprotein N-acyltransferase|nr:apolipoprotein N-acyltransferase [Spirochaetaceae bacterium]
MIVSGKWGGFFANLGAILLGALLFAGAFPNPLAADGIPILGWVAFVPPFWVIRRASAGASIFWGALYGYTAYGLFNYWLSVFHPLAGIIVGLIYLTYFALLFPLLKLAVILFPKRGYILQWLIWIAYEYLRTQGFLGYPYGISGYSQWSVLPLIQIASIFGVWGVSALVVFPSAYAAAALGSDIPVKKAALGDFIKREKFPGLAWLAALIAALIFGLVSPVDYSREPAARIALVQHNTDPWRGDLSDFRKNYRVLKRLSEEALAGEPKPDLVVWSETAFVPRIYWHVTYRDDQDSYILIRELLDFLAAQDVPFVIGNDDARKEISERGIWDRVDYNAALLFHRGEIKDIYRKLRLVPFTEYFPYEKQFPRIYKVLDEADTHFWKQGEEATVFEINGLKFSSPICFEDTFGYLSREFVRNGAEIIENLCNDAWSNSLPAQAQHAAMAVFRAVENRRSMVRATASGQTCAVDPNGKILAMAEPFTEAQLTVDVPVVTQDTPYTKFGDIWAQGFTAAAGIILILGVALGIINKPKIPRGKP